MRVELVGQSEFESTSDVGINHSPNHQVGHAGFVQIWLLAELKTSNKLIDDKKIVDRASWRQELFDSF